MDLVHSTFEPAGSGPFPTVLALHGWGASALDLVSLAPHLGGGRYLVLCPQGAVSVPIGPHMLGYGWYPLSLDRAPDPAQFGAAVDALMAFLEAAAQRYPLDPRRLAILGFSQGGTMAYALAARRRGGCAALAALSTWLPPAPLVDGSALRDLPVLVQHGDGDELVAVERGRTAVEELRRAGAALTYREYGMGHEINAASLADLDAFLRRELA